MKQKNCLKINKEGKYYIMSTNISGINVTYNESQAKKTHEKYKRDFIIEKIKYSIAKYIPWVLDCVFLFAAMASLPLENPNPSVEEMKPAFVYAGLSLASMFLTWHANKFFELIRKKNFSEPFASQYYRFINGKQILNQDFISFNDQWFVEVADSLGYTSRAYFEVERKENIFSHDTVLDLNTGCLLIPYKKQNPFCELQFNNN